MRFCIESGVGGIGMPLMVGEFFVLSEEERKADGAHAADECRGSGVPVVANCAAVNTPLAVEYARYCQEVGADAVIAMPPYIGKPDFDTIYAYFKAISRRGQYPDLDPERRRWSPSRRTRSCGCAPRSST